MMKMWFLKVFRGRMAGNVYLSSQPELVYFPLHLHVLARSSCLRVLEGSITILKSPGNCNAEFCRGKSSVGLYNHDGHKPIYLHVEELKGGIVANTCNIRRLEKMNMILHT